MIPTTAHLLAVYAGGEMDLAVTPPVVPNVVFGACIDVSNYNIVDSNGQSIVPAAT